MEAKSVIEENLKIFFERAINGNAVTACDIVYLVVQDKKNLHDRLRTLF